MTDHADTIRRALDAMHDSSPSGVNARLQHGRALDALSALLTERQQAIDERQQVIESRKEWIHKADGLLVERQQAIDERDAAILNLQRASSVRERELDARCEQAIDALREIANHVPGRYVVQSPDYVQLRARARAALLNLGEQP